MTVRRSIGPAAIRGLLLLGGALGLSGCNSGGPAQGTGKVVFSSPEEVDKKKADLQEAMKGGAYGKAGRQAASQMDPTK